MTPEKTIKDHEEEYHEMTPVEIRRCSLCGVEKPINDFYRDKYRTGGYSYICKHCSHKKVAAYEKRTGRFHSEKYRAFCRENGYGTYARRKKWLATYNETHKEEIEARAAVRAATQSGLLAKEPCKVCGEKAAQAHHYKGYSKENWLSVMWLCRTHHAKEHYG